MFVYHDKRILRKLNRAYSPPLLHQPRIRGQPITGGRHTREGVGGPEDDNVFENCSNRNTIVGLGIPKMAFQANSPLPARSISISIPARAQPLSPLPLLFLLLHPAGAGHLPLPLLDRLQPLLILSSLPTEVSLVQLADSVQAVTCSNSRTAPV